MRIVRQEALPDDIFESHEFEELQTVRQIINEIRESGDIGVRKYADQFDNLGVLSFEVSREEIQEAYEAIDQSYVGALRIARKNIERFAKMQVDMFEDVKLETDYGVIGHKVVPIKRVGCYVPGGKYPLPSSALMTVIPAKIAGVEEIILCSPRISDETIIAADIAGADRIFRIGGVQAIAAMAYGTNSIPAVDKIVGPGNKYVTAAKREVFGRVGIDFIAGPSEVLVVADCNADVCIIAADLLAQAEHDTEAKVYAICTDEALGQRLQDEIDQQLQTLPTKEIASVSVNRGYIIVEEDLDKVATLINKFAPEHLEIQLRDPKVITDKISNYGSLFIGQFSAEVFGDYCSGPNHTLPTNRSARYTGGLSVKDFLKLQTYHKLSLEGVKQLIPIASKLAAAEGLVAHQRAANIRNKLIGENRIPR